MDIKFSEVSSAQELEVIVKFVKNKKVTKVDVEYCNIVGKVVDVDIAWGGKSKKVNFDQFDIPSHFNDGDYVNILVQIEKM